MEASERTGARASGTDTSGVRIPPPLIYLAGFGAGVGPEAAFPLPNLPTALAWIALILCVAIWFALDGAAMLRFRRAGTSMVPMKPSTALVTTGPYGITRNPMYVGMGFLYAGLALVLGVIWSLILLPLVLLAVDHQVIARGALPGGEVRPAVPRLQAASAPLALG